MLVIFFYLNLLKVLLISIENISIEYNNLYYVPGNQPKEKVYLSYKKKIFDFFCYL